MEMLFSQEEVWEMSRREIARNAEQKGAEGRDALYGELLKRLEPLGRAGDLLAAITDKAKLVSLAQEFGLKM